MLSAIARPSLVLVPLPSSSMIARLCLSMFLSVISIQAGTQPRRDSIKIPENKSSLSHLRCKRRDVGFNTIIHRNPREQLTNHRKACIRGRNKASNLGHYAHKCCRSDVCALSTHIATGDDLESGLLRCVNIIWDELVIFVHLRAERQ
jgi:hypothetical protein